MWRGVARHGTAWCGAAWHGVAWHGVAWHYVAQCSVAWSGMVLDQGKLIYKEIRLHILYIVPILC